LKKVQLDCEDLLPLQENHYKIIHLKESEAISNFIGDQYNFYKNLPELKSNNVLKRITLTFSYFSDVNSAYLKEETIYKDIQVSKYP